MLHGPKETQQRAKHLRRTMSLPEITLWRELKKRPNGLRFRHQHPAGLYILDFFCPRFKLVVEIDGEAHEYGDRPQRDAARDGWLLTQGVRTLRIPAQEVLTNLEGVVQHIVTTAQNSYPGGGGGAAMR
ncbi:MAG: hypothetical protein B7Y97_09630 [Sphingomonas sp. 32-66-10]|nr:MAG: hypothetical protein B7Y97_09630 [Sphingomonas sp. 32-66-10]